LESFLQNKAQPEFNVGDAAEIKATLEKLKDCADIKFEPGRWTSIQVQLNLLMRDILSTSISNHG